MKKLVLLSATIYLCFVFTATGWSQTFTEVTAISNDLVGVNWSDAVWGDYDNDGDLDIAISGNDITSGYAEIYRNNGNDDFEAIDASLNGLSRCALAWGDYDNDGDIDLLQTGRITSTTFATYIYRNDDDGIFSQISTVIAGTGYSSAAWGDYDNDGDLDFMIGGFIGSDMSIAKVFRNDGNNNFVDINAGLMGLYKGSLDWGDYDGDGDLDILMTGSPDNDFHFAKIYRNDGNDTFTDTFIDIQGVYNSSTAFGDYDNDGDLDIALTGGPDNASFGIIYRNDGNDTFTDINAGIIGVTTSIVDWGDFDNDGDLDLLLTGWTGSERATKVYRNDGGDTFVDIGANLPGVSRNGGGWGDYDNDGDLDILLVGQDNDNDNIAVVYRNNSVTANTAPESPTDLLATPTTTDVILSWAAATDAETPSNGLTYNIRVGTSPGDTDILAPMALLDGTRTIVHMGNANHNTSWAVFNLAEGEYYWSVQAIDNNRMGSEFATEGTFTIGSTNSIDDPESNARIFQLHQNAPNPFRQASVISYQIPAPGDINLEIYNASGQLVKTLQSGFQEAGMHSITWDGTNNDNQTVNSGVYFYRLRTADTTETKRMVLMR